MLIKKRSLKCFGVLFLSFIISLVTVVLCSGDTNALRHDYKGLLLDTFTIPVPTYDPSSGSSSMDWSITSIDGMTFDGSPLELQFDGDAYDSSYETMLPNFSSSYLSLTYDSEIQQCLYSDVHSTFKKSSYPKTFSSDLGILYHPLLDSLSFPDRCNLAQSTPPIQESSIPVGLLSCDPYSNGAKCPGLWNTREYISSQILPNSYSTDGLYLISSSVDNDGIHYENMFSFFDLFDTPIHKFSYLNLPLHTTDGFYLDGDNLFSGRSFEFKGTFEFDGSFAWHSDINNNGSFFRFSAQGWPKYGQNPNWVDVYGDCTTNLIQVGTNKTRLDFSCPLTLPDDFAILVGPRLEISGNGNYAFVTDSDWVFYDLYLVTDHDETLGSPFNTDIDGGGTIPGDAANNIQNSEPDFLKSLKQLFSFLFINPFRPIFDLFTNNDSCVQIPTIAGMIHSSETQVCPWFDVNVRNILTPVLGLSSMMLLFGFAVRWLKSSSGNLFEDSGGVDTDSHHFGNKYGRNKK